MQDWNEYYYYYYYYDYYYYFIIVIIIIIYEKVWFWFCGSRDNVRWG